MFAHIRVRGRIPAFAMRATGSLSLSVHPEPNVVKGRRGSRAKLRMVGRGGERMKEGEAPRPHRSR